MDHGLLRYQDDDPSIFGLSRVDREFDDSVLSRALSQNVRVTPSLLPSVHAAIEGAKLRLELDAQVTAFVFASAEVNAHCLRGRGDREVLVFVSSSMVTLLTPGELTFAIGHELGHFLFEHFTYPQSTASHPDLRMLELARAAEISADRMGLVACADLEQALSAMLRVASGLGEVHLKIDVLEYVRQVRDLHNHVGDESFLFSTHPPLPLRVRALLRFDTALLAGVSTTSVRMVDDQTRSDIDRAATGVMGNRFTDQAMSAAFWQVAYDACRTGVLTEVSRRTLLSRFGKEKVDALVRRLGATSRPEAIAFLAARRDEAREQLRGAPLFLLRAVDAAVRGR
jgi:hypothetical protein